MQRARPFQFGLRAIFGLTVIAAALAWLARGLEPVLAFVSLPYVCLGLLQCVLAYGLWTELPALELGTPRRPALESALCVFVLTMPTWGTALVFLLLLRIGFEVPLLLFVAGIHGVLLGNHHHGIQLHRLPRTAP